jgi:hypothetical protein
MFTGTGCTASVLRRVDLPTDLLTRERHELRPSTELEYLSCNYRAFQYLHDPSLQVVRDNFIYALMSSNAYDNIETAHWVLTGWDHLERNESNSDLSFDVYRRELVNQPEDIVIAYRGTEGWKDWTNNLALIEPPQYREAFRHLRALRVQRPQARITATGHSLGGGIALSMSLRVPGVAAVVFNSSPQLTLPLRRERNSRVHIFEIGEVLNPLNRTFLRLVLPRLSAYKFNFLDFTIHTVAPVQEHSMYLLSRALLLAAIRAGSPDAKTIFVENIGIETARAVEWSVCRELFEEGTGSDSIEPGGRSPISGASAQ